MAKSEEREREREREKEREREPIHVRSDKISWMVRQISRN
jgi:hypothetical protein